MYSDGSNIEIDIKADEGYVFDGWVGDLERASSLIGFTVDSDKYISAEILEYRTYDFVIEFENASVSINEKKVKSGEVVSFGIGEIVTLEVAEDDGYVFKNWTGDITSEDVKKIFKVTNDMNIKANLDKLCFLEVAFANAQVLVDGAILNSGMPVFFEEGSSVELEMILDNGYHFGGWNGGITSTKLIETIIINSDLVITADVFKSFELIVNFDKATVTANGNPLNSGVPISFREGTSVSLQAQMTSGYQSNGWSGDLVSSEESIEVVLSKNITVSLGVTAVHSVTVNYSNASVVLNGKTIQNGVPELLEIGTAVTIELTPSSEFVFKTWSGDFSGSSKSFSFIVNKDITISAQLIHLFQLIVNFQNAQVTVNGAIAQSGTVIQIEDGTQVSLGITPSAGFTFKKWIGDLSSSNNSESFSLNKNMIIGADILALHDLTVNYAHSKVTLNGNTVTSGLSYSFEEGTTVILTVTADDGYVFKKWLGDLSGSDLTNQITLTTEMVIEVETAVLCSLNVDFLNASISVGGTPLVSGSPTIFEQGSLIVLSAVADVGYRFNQWTGDLTDSNETVSFNLNSDMQVELSTVKLNSLTLDFLHATIDVNGTPAVTGVAVYYEPNIVVSLSITPDTGYKFKNWSGDLTSNEQIVDLVIDSDKVIGVNTIAEYSLTLNFDHASISVNETPMVSGTPSFFESDTQITLSLLADSGFRFKNWNGDLSGSNDTVSFPISSNMSASVNIAALYSLSVNFDYASVTANGLDLVSGSAIILEENTYISLKLTSDAGYRFNSWSGDFTSSNASAGFNINQNMVITASLVEVFDLIVTFSNASVQADAYTLSSGVVRQFEKGQDVTLVIQVDPGYKLDSWSGDLTGNNVSNIILMNSDLNIGVSLIETIVENSIEIASFNRWLSGSITKAGLMDEFYFTTVVGKYYRVSVDDSAENSWYDSYVRKNSPTPTLNVYHKPYRIAGYGQPDVSDYDLSYLAGGNETAQSWYASDAHAHPYLDVLAVENQTYIAVKGYRTTETGSYYIKVQELDACVLDLIISPPEAQTEGVTVSGGGTFPTGAKVDLKPEAVDSWVFKGWQDESSSIVSTDLDYSFTLNSDLTLTAIFDKAKIIWQDDFESGSHKEEWGQTWISSLSRCYSSTPMDTQGYGESSYSMKFPLTYANTTIFKTLDLNITQAPVTIKYNYWCNVTSTSNGLRVCDNANGNWLAEHLFSSNGWQSGSVTISTTGKHEIVFKATNGSVTYSSVWLDNVTVCADSLTAVEVLPLTAHLVLCDKALDVNNIKEDGYLWDFGSQPEFTDYKQDWFLLNIGKKVAEITAINFSNDSSNAFSLSIPGTIALPKTLNPLTGLSFTSANDNPLILNALAGGPYSAEIEVLTNGEGFPADGDVNFTITGSCYAVEPDITIEYRGTEINHNDTVSLVSASSVLGLETEYVFDVKTALGRLNMSDDSSVSLLAGGDSRFTIKTQPPEVINSSQAESFILSYIGDGTLNSASAMVQIENDDPDEGTFLYEISMIPEIILFTDDFEDQNIDDWTNNITGSAAYGWEMGPNGSATLGSSSSYLYMACNSFDVRATASATSTVIDTTSLATVNLSFEQCFSSSQSPSGKIEVFDGTNWVTIETYSSNSGSYSSPRKVDIDVTAYSNLNFQLRFVYSVYARSYWYSSKSSWAIDNIIIK